MTVVESVIASVAAIVGAYEAFLSMFVQRSRLLVWISSPLVWPASWVLNGPIGRFRLAYLVVYVVVIASNAATYALLSWLVLRFARQRLQPRMKHMASNRRVIMAQKR
jgi:hypothetical protein